MKKNLIIAIAAAGLMYSCGSGTSKEEMQSTADKICNCVADKEANRGEISADVLAKTVKEEFSSCALDAINSGIDITTADFKTIMSENCANLKETYNAFLEEIK